MIQCRLKTVDLESARGTYIPLSYCWRKSPWKKPRTYRIQIDDAEFTVGDNLHDFLKRFRRRLKDSNENLAPMLWIDAICINQIDIAEKSVQVAIMGSVYRGGSQTLVWLGEETWDGYRTKKAFQFLCKAAEQARRQPELLRLSVEERAKKEWEEARSQTPYVFRWLHGLLETFSRELLLSSILSIHQRPYFSRAWIVQEVLLSSTVIILCGRQEMTWEDLSLGMRWRGRWHRRSYHFRAVDALRSDLPIWRETEPTLEATMARLSETDATDLRDKIYSALSLVPDTVDIAVDYEKDQETVFEEFTIKTIFKTRKLDVLSMGRGTSPDSSSSYDGFDEAAPSWAWNPSPRPFFRLSFQVPGSLYPFKASQLTKCDPYIEGHTLILYGMVLDEIETVGEMMSKPRFMMDIRGFLASIECYAEWRKIAGLQEHDGRSVNQEMFCRTLNPLSHKRVTADTGLADAERAENADLFEKFDQEIMHRFGRHVSVRQKQEPAQRPAGSSWVSSTQLKKRSILRLCVALAEFLCQLGLQNSRTLSAVAFAASCNGIIGQRIVKCRGGLVGLCPWQTRPADRIVLLKGADVPFVLRPVAVAGGRKPTLSRWTIVGECYVHTVMYGEAWDESRCHAFHIV